MPKPNFTKPFYMFFLVLPYGISSGFCTVALPFLLVKSGFPVAEAAAITALGFSANIYRFVWGPVADLTLSLRKWYWIGVLFTVVTLMLLCLFPFHTSQAALLTAIIFLSQVAATFVVLPVGGFMAYRLEEHHKGRGGGWYQAGNLGGTGLGGGAGLWLANHYSITIAGIVLSVACLIFALVVQLIKDHKSDQEKGIWNEMKLMGNDLWKMIRIPVLLFALILLLMPIGTGAAGNVWSAIAVDWEASPDQVALVTGILSGLISAVGSVLGGWIADKFGIWVAYFFAGVLAAVVVIIMAFMPYQPWVFVAGVLAYAMTTGLVNGAFTAVGLFVAGKTNASTKYALVSSIGNVPVVYMTAVDGWTHDLHNSKFMLITEGIIALIFITIFSSILQMMRRKKLVLKTID